MIDTQVTKIILYSYIKLIQFIFFPISLNECDNIEIAKLFKKEIPESKKRVVELLFCSPNLEVAFETDGKKDTFLLCVW